MKLGRLGKLVNPAAHRRFMALFLIRDRHFAFRGGVMAIKVGGRKRSLSKKVSAFNMYDDQVYQDSRHHGIHRRAQRRAGHPRTSG